MKIKKLVSLIIAVACLVSCFAGTASASGYKINKAADEAVEKQESSGNVSGNASDVVVKGGEVTFP